MECSINQIIEYFATSTIQFVDAFISKLPPYHQDKGRTTAKGKCGLVIPIKGHARFSFNQTAYEMNDKTIVHAGSNMAIHVETFDEEWEYAVVHYRIVDAPAHFQQMLHQHLLIAVDDCTKILWHVQQLLQQQAKPGYLSKLQSQVLFMNLLESLVLAAHQKQHNRKGDVIQQALDYIHQHYAQDIVISELAESFHMERRKFSALFERFTGLTPIQYLTEYRIARAKELLMAGIYSISDISEAVGYQDSFYFSRVFKKHVHMSPSTYRKEFEKNPYSKGG